MRILLFLSLSFLAYGQGGLDTVNAKAYKLGKLIISTEALMQKWENEKNPCTRLQIGHKMENLLPLLLAARVEMYAAEAEFIKFGDPEAYEKRKKIKEPLPTISLLKTAFIQADWWVSFKDRLTDASWYDLKWCYK